MENTTENKLKFFAQYFWQRVLKRKLILSNRIYIIDYQEFFNISMLPDNHYLELRSIDSITDEECVEYYNLVNIHSKFLTTQVDFKTKVIDTKKELSFFKSNMYSRMESDFFRSKGFLLPFMNLTTDQILEFGWAKLKKL